MTTTLYRKYRPQLFRDVVGQEHVTTTLQHQITNAKVAHAYLFCGTRGVGKTTVARLLAKALNCAARPNSTAEPCGTCGSCRAIAAGLSLDLIEVDAASNRRIDDVRELREHIPYGPTSSAYKVVIIDEVHMLTSEAFNALLKILEEPPAHVVFVLATTEVHKLPDTIISRCQRYDFRRLSSATLTERLTQLAQAEGVTVEPDVLREVAYLAQGSSRDAEGYLGKLISLGERHIGRTQANLVLPHFDQGVALQVLADIVDHRATSVVTRLNIFHDEGGDLSQLHRQILEFMRQLMLLKLAGREADVQTYHTEAGDALAAMATNVSQSRAQAMLERWLAATDNWHNTDLPQLPLELAAISLAEPTHGLLPMSPSNPDATHQPLPPSQPQPNSTVTSLSQIQERWGEVVQKLRSYNHSLSFILSIARPTALEGSTLTVTLQYPLHQDRVQDPKVRRVIEEVLHQVTGNTLKLAVRLEPAAVGTDLLSNVLSTLGGEIVE